MAEATETAREHRREYERGKAERSTFEVLWQRVAQYIYPDRADFLVTRAAGQKRMQHVYDGTPILAHQEQAAGLHGLATSPYLKWFHLEADSERLNKIDRVRVWLAAAEDELYRCFQSSRAHFTRSAHEFYLDFTSIGTAVLSVLPEGPEGIRYACRSLRECVLDEGEGEDIDTLYRAFEFTAKQAVEKWGDGAPDKVKQAWAETPGRKFRFLHGVRPRKIRDQQRADNRNMPWESVYSLYETGETITEGGFQEFPFACGRYARVTADEIYGRSGAISALPDIQMLNEMQKLDLKAAQKVIDPPLQLPSNAFLVPIKTLPGSLNYYEAGAQGRIEPIKTGGDLALSDSRIQRRQMMIMRMFHTDWLRQPQDLQDPGSSGKGVTATFTMQVRDENMRLQSPQLGRITDELCDPAVERTFNLRWRRSLALRFGPGSPFPPPPPELSGQRLTVRYVSPIAVAQRASALDGLGRMIQLGAALTQFDPEAPQVIDGEGAMRFAGDVLNAPPAILKSAAAMAAMRQQQQAQAAASHAGDLANAALAGTGAIKNLAQANQAQPMAAAA